MENPTEERDRGWSWIIAFAACFNSLVYGGIVRSSGVLFVAFISEFGVTREEASWPVVLCLSVSNLTGIVAGPLGLKFGVRLVTIIGALIATTGISSCFFSTSLNTITFLFGAVFGVGFGLVSTLMPVIVNEYFLDLRALANGIANSGACFGSIIFPLLFEYLIDIYGLPGCFLITGGIVLHITISGALMRPPSWLHKSIMSNVQACSDDVFKTETVSRVTANSFSRTNEYDAVIKSIEYRNSKVDQKEIVLVSEPINSPEFSKHSSEDETLISSALKSKSIIDETYLKKDFIFESGMFQKNEIQLKNSRNEDLKRLIQPISVNTEKQDFQINSQIENANISNEHSRVSKNKSRSVSLNVLTSFKYVLTCPMFYITAITNVIFYSLYQMFIIIIVDFSIDRGVPEKNTKYIIFAFAICDLFGRLCLGWITDRKLLRRPHYVMACMILIGIIFFSFPFASSYTLLIVISCFYGLLVGCTMVVFPILLVDFLGIEMQAVAFGCVCFLNGLASFVRPLFIGYIRDNMGSYSEIFYVHGGIALAVSFLWLLETCLVKIDKTNTDV